MRPNGLNFCNVVVVVLCVFIRERAADIHPPISSTFLCLHCVVACNTETTSDHDDFFTSYAPSGSKHLTIYAQINSPNIAFPSRCLFLCSVLQSRGTSLQASF